MVQQAKEQDIFPSGKEGNICFRMKHNQERDFHYILFILLYFFPKYKRYIFYTLYKVYIYIYFGKKLMSLDEHYSYTYIISSRMVKSDRNEIEFLSSKQGANIFLTFNDFCNKIYFSRQPQRLKWMLQSLIYLLLHKIARQPKEQEYRNEQ